MATFYFVTRQNESQMGNHIVAKSIKISTNQFFAPKS